MAAYSWAGSILGSILTLFSYIERSEVVRRSGQIAVPVIDDGGTVIADSTQIVAFLDERYPLRPVIPRDPALRARALLLEEGFDEGLGRTIQPVC